MVYEHPGEYELEWAAIASIAAMIGCSGEAIRYDERVRGLLEGMTTEVRERLAAHEHESRKLWQTNEILQKASASFAQAEVDRRSKT